MKKYIVYDDYTNYTYKKDEKELKALLVEEIKNDTLVCGEDDFEIVKSNFKVMEKLALNDYDFDYLKDQLQSFGWYIQDLSKLQEELSNYQAYKHGVGAPSYPDDCIEETLKMIEKDMN